MSPAFEQSRRSLVAARRDARAVERWPADAIADLDDAYRLQSAVAAELGRTCGWKVTAVTEAQRTTLGVDRPIAGPLLAPWTFDARAGRPRLRLAAFVAAKLEGELAFELGADLPARATPYSRAEVERAVAALRVGVELVDSRLPPGSPTLAQLADAFNNGAYVAGPATADWRALDLAGDAIVLSRLDAGGAAREVSRGNARAILDGDPFAAVVMLANAQPTSGPGLRRGDLVTTGSCTGAPPLPGPGVYRADFGALGRFEFEVVDGDDAISEQA